MNLQVGVKVIIQNSQGHVLLLKRASQFLLPADSKEAWDIPGGRIERDENLHDALAREVKEETGATLVDTPKLLIAQDIFVPNRDLHVVRLTYTLEQNLDTIVLSDEHTDYQWFTKSDLQNVRVEPYLAEALQLL